MFYQEAILMAEPQLEKPDQSPSGKLNLIDAMPEVFFNSIQALAELKVLRDILADHGIQIDKVKFKASVADEIIEKLDKLQTHRGSDIGRMADITLKVMRDTRNANPEDSE